MTLASRETIFALASAAGKAGVAVFRVSGPNAFDAIAKMTNLGKLEHKKMNVATIYSPMERHSTIDKEMIGNGTVDNETIHKEIIGKETINIGSVDKETNSKRAINRGIIDKGMIVSFEKPNSFTGENVVEFHVHGSLAVMNRMLHAFSIIDGFRLAERGEFCKRAWMNNKMNLGAVEALTDLIDSKTEVQRKTALNQMISNNYWDKWTRKVTEALALIEAVIDFEEEVSIIGNAKRIVQSLVLEMSECLEMSRRRSFIRDGFQVAIVGPTNAGKSSFINLIAKRKVSIVSPIPGTTRDIVRASIDLEGYPVEFCDTAGLRESDSTIDPIESEGIDLAKEISRTSNLVLFMLDATCEWHLSKAELQQENCIFIVNKIDKLSDQEMVELRAKFAQRRHFFVSCLNGVGIERICQEISNVISAQFQPDEENISVLNQRQFGHLACCIKNLNLFLLQADVKQDVAVAAEYLRMAIETLGNITGRVGTEQILGIIFARFCIGK